MKATEFLDLVESIEAWQAAEGPPNYQEMRAQPFFEVIEDQRLTGTVWALRKAGTGPMQRRHLWTKIKARLAQHVTRGAPTGKSEGEWKIKIPAASCGFLSSNKRLDRNVEARLRAEWRRHAFTIGQTQRRFLPRDLAYVKVDLQLQMKTYRLRDNANYYITAKPIVDAFGPDRRYQREGVWVNERGLRVYLGDDPVHMAGPYLDWFDEAYTGPLEGVVWMRIIDLSPRRSAAPAS